MKTEDFIDSLSEERKQKCKESESMNEEINRRSSAGKRQNEEQNSPQALSEKQLDTVSGGNEKPHNNYADPQLIDGLKKLGGIDYPFNPPPSHTPTPVDAPFADDQCV